jgi:hypothetical protein
MKNTQGAKCRAQEAEKNGKKLMRKESIVFTLSALHLAFQLMRKHLIQGRNKKNTAGSDDDGQVQSSKHQLALTPMTYHLPL